MATENVNVNVNVNVDGNTDDHVNGKFMASVHVHENGDGEENHNVSANVDAAENSNRSGTGHSNGNGKFANNGNRHSSGTNEEDNAYGTTLASEADNGHGNRNSRVTVTVENNRNGSFNGSSKYAQLVKMRIYSVDGHVVQPREFGESRPSSVANRLASAFFGQRPIVARPRSSVIGFQKEAEEAASRAVSRRSVRAETAAPQDTLGSRCRRMLSAQLRRKVQQCYDNDSTTATQVDVDRLIDSLLFRPVTSLGRHERLQKIPQRRAKTATAARTSHAQNIDALLMQRSELASRLHSLESEFGLTLFSNQSHSKRRQSLQWEDEIETTAAQAAATTTATLPSFEPARASVAESRAASGTPMRTAGMQSEEAQELQRRLKDDSFLGKCTFDCEEDCEASQRPTVSKFQRNKQVQEEVQDDGQQKPVVQEHVQKVQYGLSFAMADIARKVIDNENMGITTHQSDDEDEEEEQEQEVNESQAQPATGTVIKAAERVKDAKELRQEVQQLRKKRRLMTPIEKLRAAVKLIKYLIQATTTSKQIESKKEARLLTFAEMQQAITEDIQESTPAELVFNPNIFRACKEVRLGEEAKDILSIHPNSRSDRDQQLSLIALNQSVQAFSEFPLKMQQKLVQVGWYEKFGPKRVIIRQGHTALKFYFILSGTAVVSVSRHNKKTGESYTETIAILKKGNTFGELALMYGGRRSATITSFEEIELLSLSRDDFVDIFMNLKANSEPEHISFLRTVPTLKHFPINELPYDDPKICLFMYFRRNSVLCRDSNNSEWIYIIKTGTCRVVKDLKVPENYLESEIGVNLLSGNMTNPEREKQTNLMKFVAPPNMFPPARYLEWRHHQDSSRARSANQREQQEEASKAAASCKRTLGPAQQRKLQLQLQHAANKKIAASKKVFVQIQKLEARDVFTLLPIAFDFMGDSTSVSLVSDGAECVLINKQFFKRFCSETYLGWLRHTLQPYPRDAVMQLNLEDYTWWRFYKQQLVESVVVQQQMMNEYVLNV